MFKKLKELWNRFDIWMMMNPAKTLISGIGGKE